MGCREPMCVTEVTVEQVMANVQMQLTMPEKV
jgi:hypothetical protein